MPWQIIHFKCQEKEGIVLVLNIIDPKAILQIIGKSACTPGHEASIIFPAGSLLSEPQVFRDWRESQLSLSAHCLHQQKLTECFGPGLIYCTSSLPGVKMVLFNAIFKAHCFLNTYTLDDFSNILPTHVC